MPIIRVCARCGKSFKISPSYARRYNFCSMKCKRQPHQIRHCKWCGKFFKTMIHRDGTGRIACSQSCAGHLNRGKKRPYMLGINNPSHSPVVRAKIAKSKIGRLNPMWTTALIRKCSWCERAIIRKPHKFKGHKLAFCNVRCLNSFQRRLFQTRNPMCNLVSMNKMRRTMKKLYSNPQFKKQILLSRSRHPNKLEDAMMAFVRTHNLPFSFVGDWSFWIGPCKSGRCRNPDFIHVDRTKKLALLVSGRYHHARTWRTEIADYKSVQWTPIWVWEDEFYTNPQGVLDKILKELEKIAMETSIKQ